MKKFLHFISYNLRSNTLVLKMLLRIFIFSSAITLIGTSYQVYVFFMEDIDYIDKQFELIEQSHLKSIANSLWNYNNVQLKTEILGILGLRDIEYIEVRNLREVIEKSGEKPRDKKTITRIFTLTHLYRGKVQTIGSLYAFASLEGAYARIINKIWLILVTQSIKTFLVSMFIMFMFHYLVTRHLVTMAEHARQFSIERLGFPLKLVRKSSGKDSMDEIDEVAASINLMQVNLEKYISERNSAEAALSDAYEELERRVEMRTEALLSVNVILKSEIEEKKRAEDKLLIYQKQLRALSSKLLFVEEIERRQIATDLHDSIGQSLAITKMKLSYLQKQSYSKKVNTILTEVLGYVSSMIHETRSLTFELSPPVLYDLGLPQAVEWLIEHMRTKQESGINFIFIDESPPGELDNSSRVLLFRAIRELLYNIVKHARASIARVTIKEIFGSIEIIVEDNGMGFDPAILETQAIRAKGFGLFSVNERLSHINGTISIYSRPGLGSRFVIKMPLDTIDAPDL